MGRKRFPCVELEEFGERWIPPPSELSLRSIPLPPPHYNCHSPMKLPFLIQLGNNADMGVTARRRELLSMSENLWVIGGLGGYHSLTLYHLPFTTIHHSQFTIPQTQQLTTYHINTRFTTVNYFCEYIL